MTKTDEAKSKLMSTTEYELKLQREKNQTRMKELEILEKMLKANTFPISCTPISEGIDPPSEWPPQQENHGRKVHDIPCKKCGKQHGLCLETMSTGHMEPLDICSECLFAPPNYPKREGIMINIGAHENE
jgi:hypothetical protein